MVEADQFPPRREARRVAQPTVYGEPRSRTAVLAAVEDLAHSFGISGGGRVSFADLISCVPDQLKAHGVQILTPEELQR